MWDSSTYEPDLAERLNRYGLSLRKLGEHDKACEVYRESVEITQQLHEHNPVTYESPLADRRQDYKDSSELVVLARQWGQL